MTDQNVDLTKLRKNIAQEADAWLHEHVYKRLDQEAAVSKLSPERFLYEKRFGRVEPNQVTENEFLGTAFRGRYKSQ